MSKSLSLIDFIADIAEAVVSPSGKKESLYDINFTNHYTSLHTFEETCKNTIKQKMPIEQIVQDKKSKSINVKINTEIAKNKAEKVKAYCTSNNIDCDISRGKLKSITITKNSKGVLEERKWKK